MIARDYIDLVDGAGALYGALNGNAVGLSVLDCVDNYTGGTWTSGPSNAGGSSGATTFTCSGATFASYMVGWTLVANVDKPTYFTIASVPSATTLTVSGDCDATSISQSGDRFEILAPACVASYGETGSNSIPGAIADPQDFGAPDSADPGSRILWAGYWYLPPQVGLNVASSITGTQPTLSNLQGHYHCWNRVYSPFMGRWTTPDPAMSPWWNLWDYCESSPIDAIDPVGLSTTTPKGERRTDIKHTQLPKGTPSTDTPPKEGVRDTITVMGIDVYFELAGGGAGGARFLEEGFYYGDRIDTACASSQKVTYWRKYEETLTGTFHVYRQYDIDVFVTQFKGQRISFKRIEYALLYSIKGSIFQITVNSWEYNAYVWICCPNPPARDDTKKMGEVGAKAKREKGEEPDSRAISSSAPIVPEKK